MTELTVEPTDRNTLEETDDEQRPAAGVRVHQLQQIGASLKRTRVTYNLQGNIHDVSDTLRLGYDRYLCMENERNSRFILSI